MKEYTNDMRAKRMGLEKDETHEGTVVSPIPAPGKSQITSSNEAKATKEPHFDDAGTFLRGGGKCDGEMENIGNVGSIPKGTPDPGRPNVEKGTPGPQCPGAI